MTLPRARFDIRPDGHLTATVDGRPWQPPSDDPTRPSLGTVRLDRSDVLWARQQIANELGTPVFVQVVEDGRPYSDVIEPDGYRTEESPETLSGPDAGEGPYAPGEPVSISVVVGQTHADEHGHVRYRLPAALADRAVLVHGEASATTRPLDTSPLPEPSADAVEAPSRRGFMGRNFDVRRRQPGSDHPRPARRAPAPAPRATADDRLGAL
ncbi:hypothetical protein ACIGB8_17640 [Promicromonospora sukumoe]|uniref:hypothetical protein n=1 Tax=Promicromonospora sukumoe TaxID=88382 RepID=UPI0037C79B54